MDKYHFWSKISKTCGRQITFGKSIFQVPDTGMSQYWRIQEHFLYTKAYSVVQPPLSAHSSPKDVIIGLYKTNLYLHWKIYIPIYIHVIAIVQLKIHVHVTHVKAYRPRGVMGWGGRGILLDVFMGRDVPPVFENWKRKDLTSNRSLFYSSNTVLHITKKKNPEEYESSWILNWYNTIKWWNTMI